MTSGTTPTAIVQWSGLRREVQLLLCCARTTMDDEARRRATSLLAEDLDWDYFLPLVTRHRVVPLVHQCFAGFDQVPPKIVSILAQQHEHIARRNVFLTGRLVELLRLFTTEDVRAIAYKGPAIAAVAYGKINLRQFWDLDVLVHSRDHRRARDLLMSRSGYELRDDWGWECHLVDRTGMVLVDLHRHIGPDLRPGTLWFDGLWHRREHAASAGGIPTLGAEDMLVVLTIQLCKDARDLRLSKLCDIAELLRARPSLDWNAVSTAARRLGCQRALSFALTIARELLDAPVDVSIVGSVDHARMKPLAGYVYHRLFAEGPTRTSPPMSHAGFRFRIRERWRDGLYAWYTIPRVRIFARHFRPSAKDRSMITLPARLGFLYYLVRPIRVGRDYARSWFKGP